MIDTVRIKVMAEYNGELPESWSKREHKESNKGYIKKWTCLSNSENGIYIRFTPLGNATIQASLPRILHGSNCFLIKSQDEINSSVEKVLKICSSVFWEPPEIIGFPRVDLVWHFTGNFEIFKHAHWYCETKHVRKEKTIYRRGSITWPGSQIYITMYDKKYEKWRKKGNIVRLEVEVKRSKVLHFLGDGQPITKLDYGDCYETYRSIVHSLYPPPEDIPNVTKIVDVLLLADEWQITVNDMSLADYYMIGKSPATICKLKRALSTQRLQKVSINWLKLLPKNSFPPVVEFSREEYLELNRQQETSVKDLEEDIDIESDTDDDLYEPLPK